MLVAMLIEGKQVAHLAVNGYFVTTGCGPVQLLIKLVRKISSGGKSNICVGRGYTKGVYKGVHKGGTQTLSAPHIWGINY